MRSASLAANHLLRCFNQKACLQGAASCVSPEPLAIGARKLHVHSSNASESLDLIGAATTSSSSLSIDAASGLEPLALLFNPTNLGMQFWELCHTSSGLPWWATIPAAALGARALLFPLSLKAKKASTNLLLWQQAFEQARQLTRDMDRPTARAFGGMLLVRRIRAHLQTQHKPPALKWYIFNAALQVPLFFSLHSALKTMAADVWPGMADQGLLYFKDLTAPPVYLETLSTPYGTLGAMLPLLITYLYITALDKSVVARTPGLDLAMRMMCIPVYGFASLQPHAVLLYWLSTALANSALQGLMAAPGPAKAMGMPEVLLPPSHQTSPPPKPSTLLLALGRDYQARDRPLAAAACYSRVLEGEAESGEALRGLADAAEALENYEEAARQRRSAARVVSEEEGGDNTKAAELGRAALLFAQAATELQQQQARQKEGGQKEQGKEEAPGSAASDLLSQASSCAQEALALHPGEPLALLAQAVAQASEGQAADAAASAVQAADFAKGELEGVGRAALGRALLGVRLVVLQLRAQGDVARATEVASRAVMEVAPLVGGIEQREMVILLEDLQREQKQ